jgi:hypothetical protein
MVHEIILPGISCACPGKISRDERHRDLMTAIFKGIPNKETNRKAREVCASHALPSAAHWGERGGLSAV